MSQYWNSHSSKITSLPESTKGDSGSGLEGLEFQRHCPNCGFALQLSIFAQAPVAPDTPSKRHHQKPVTRRCTNCKPRQPLPTRLPCVICGEVVDGMLVPCLSCGHVSCFDCHQRWFLRPGDQFDSPFNPSGGTTLPSCPSGCGCNCSEHVAANVPMPPWETKSPQIKDIRGTPSRGVSYERRHRHRQSEPAGSDSGAKILTSKVGVGQQEDELDMWQTSSPFASLARGMGGGLSQGLRSKEERKKNRSVAIAIPKGK